MPDELNPEQTMDERPEEAASTTSTAERQRRIRKRDFIDWVEFGIAILEVLLTITITILIVYELFYARHQDELASRAPQITLSQNSFSIQVVPPDIKERPMELVTPEVGLIYNGGHAALVNGSVTAFTDQQDVKIACTDNATGCRTHFEPGYAFPGVDFDLGTLAVHRGAQIKFTVVHMSNHKPFKVRLSVSGDNIEPYKVTDLPFDQTMSPPPTK
jgi:hypothetical protein